LDPEFAHAATSQASKTGPTVSPASTTHRPTRQAPSIHDAKRPISTGGPSTALKNHGAVALETDNVIAGLKVIYKHEGFAGLFRGVGPRFVWTSVQSGTMLVMYQQLLKYFELHPLVASDEDELALS
ncbi:hypothetical protein KCU79_g20524, partial [Aureobasidium melanogenum]